MKTVCLHNKYYKVPGSWNELTPVQLLKLVGLMEHTDLQALLRMMRCLLNMGRRAFGRLPADEILDSLYLMDFLFERNDLTKNLIPYFRGFYGPADDSANLLMCEFVYAEDYLNLWKEGDEQALNLLVAVLYRKGKRGYDRKRNLDGDVRVAFNEYECQYHAGRIGRWPLVVRKSIAHWYEGCLHSLMKAYPDVFSTSGGAPLKYGLVEVISDVAENGIYGNFKEVEMQPVRLILMQLDRMVRQAKKQQQHG